MNLSQNLKLITNLKIMRLARHKSNKSNKNKNNY